VPPGRGGRWRSDAGAEIHPGRNRTMNQMTLDVERIEVVSYPTQNPEAREDACPTASATLTGAQ
jgi:hypothetical protein